MPPEARLVKMKDAQVVFYAHQRTFYHRGCAPIPHLSPKVENWGLGPRPL